MLTELDILKDISRRLDALGIPLYLHLWAARLQVAADLEDLLS